MIAIIAILANLLLPALSKSKNAALTTQCKSNQHQIGVAMMSFVGDNAAYPGIGLPPTQTNIFSPLFTYTGCASTGPLYQCPTFRMLLGFETNNSTGPNGVPRYAPHDQSTVGSYGWNGNGTSPLGAGTHYLGLTQQKDSKVKSPSNMYALGDAYVVFGSQDVEYGINAIGINRPASAKNPIQRGEELAGTRHGGMLNVLIADGHVETPTWQKLLLDRSDDALRRWNVDNQPHRELLVP